MFQLFNQHLVKTCLSIQRLMIKLRVLHVTDKTLAFKCRLKEGEPWRGDLLLHGGDLRCPDDEELKSYDIYVLGSNMKGCCCEEQPTTTTTTTSKFRRMFMKRFLNEIDFDDDEEDFFPLSKFLMYRAAPPALLKAAPALLKASPKSDIPIAAADCYFADQTTKTNPISEYMQVFIQFGVQNSLRPTLFRPFSPLQLPLS